LIDRRSSAEVPHLVLRAALEYCAAGGAKVATIMGHAGSVCSLCQVDANVVGMIGV
jgi:hypothetical protein